MWLQKNCASKWPALRRCIYTMCPQKTCLYPIDRFSQGSVATQLRYGGIINNHYLILRCLQNEPVKFFLKIGRYLAKIWQVVFETLCRSDWATVSGSLAHHVGSHRSDLDWVTVGLPPQNPCDGNSKRFVQRLKWRHEGTPWVEKIGDAGSCIFRQKRL